MVCSLFVFFFCFFQKISIILTSEIRYLCAWYRAHAMQYVLRNFCCFPWTKSSRPAWNWVLLIKHSSKLFDLQNGFKQSILKSELSLISQNFSFWLVLCGEPSVLNLVKTFFNFFTFICSSFRSVLFSINYFSFIFSIIIFSILFFTRTFEIFLTKKPWPMSSISKPATVVITFWKFLTLYHFFLLLQQRVIISNKMAYKRCLTSNLTIAVGLQVNC